jgi:hypothetical protein
MNVLAYQVKTGDRVRHARNRPWLTITDKAPAPNGHGAIRFTTDDGLWFEAMGDVTLEIQ